ncbi:transposase [bacterium]|nr:MAG: transposase [bacterium]
MKLGWTSRGYLPHRDEVGLIQFITLRLADSLPQEVVEEMQALAKTPNGLVEGRRRAEKYLDSGYGSCTLGRSEIANMVEKAMLHRHPDVWELFAWTIMPNHLHMLLRFADDIAMAKVLQVFKGWTANQANGMLGVRGTYWFREYHDRYIRDERHFANCLAYIDVNSVKAGLCERAEDWAFGSARFRGLSYGRQDCRRSHRPPAGVKIDP